MKQFFSSAFRFAIQCAMLVWCCLCPAPALMAQGPSSCIDTTWVAALPVIELNYDAQAFNADTFIPATFTFHDADTVRQYSCKVRHRGGTSLRFDKPNFAIKFLNKEGEAKDVRFMDMRKDNNWILDAMASDFGKIRNRVSMDLWLDFSRPPYHQELEPKAVNGYHGRYVEVYANGGYMGLFCLMERVDRKQLKLQKFVPDEADSTLLHHRGLMYKAVNSASTRTGFFYWQEREPNNALEFYDGVQCEYPDVTAGEPWTWTPLRDNIYFLAARSGKTFMNGVPLRFDVPVFIDYVLFIDLLYAPDNVGKNFYCWFYDQTTDQRIGFTPWDLDTSWGRDYLGNRVAATSLLKNKSNFDTRMALRYTGYADTLALRYAELRDSLWSEAALNARLDQYFQLFDTTGVWQRDQARWEGRNCKVRPLADEQSYMQTWMRDRLCYLDSIYGYEPPSAISQISADPRPQGSRPMVDLWGRPFLTRSHDSALPSQPRFFIRDGKLCLGYSL